MGESSKRSQGNSGLISLHDAVWDSKCQLSCIAIHPEALGSEDLERIVKPLKRALIERGFSLKTISEESIINGYTDASGLNAPLYALMIKGAGPGLQYSYGFLKGQGKFVLTIRDLSDDESHPSTENNLQNSSDDQQNSPNNTLNEICVGLTLKSGFAPGDGGEIQIDIDQYMPEIIKCYLSELLKAYSGLNPEHSARLNESCTEVLEFYTGLRDYDYEVLNTVFEKLTALRIDSGIDTPALALKLLATLYTEYSADGRDAEAGAEKALNNAAGIYEGLSSFEPLEENKEIYNVRLGDTLLTLYGISGNRDYVDRALELYLGALDNPGDDAGLELKSYINVKTAEAYYILSGLCATGEERIGYLQKSIEYADNVISLYGSRERPAEYGGLMRLKGLCLFELGESGGSCESLRLSVETLTESLKYYNPEGSKELFAEAQTHLGNAYRTLAGLDDSIEDCIMGIEAYERALLAYPSGRCESERALLHNYLGLSYDILARLDESEESCRGAVECYRKALEFYSIDEHPEEYAQARHNLGNAYSALGELGDKAQNSEKALESYLETLKVWTIERYPHEYAKTKNNLGVTYSTLSEVKDEKENSVKAASSFEDAIEFFKGSDYPIELAMVSNNLGDAYSILSTEDDAEGNLEKAAQAYQKALSVYEENGYGLNTTLVRKKLGDVFYSLTEFSEEGDYESKSYTNYEGVVELYNREEHPYEYARIKMNMGRLLMRMAGSEGSPLGFKGALEAFQEALSIFNGDEYPNEYLTLKQHMGDAYKGLSELRDLSVIEDRAVNIENAISHYEAALNVPGRYSAETHSIILNNIGRCRTELALKKESLEEFKLAVREFEKALSILNAEHEPLAYALIENNMGAVYCMMEQLFGYDKYAELGSNALMRAVPDMKSALSNKNGEKQIYAVALSNLGAASTKTVPTGNTADNLRESIEYLNEALTVIDPERNPGLRARIQNNLGSSYLRLADIEDAEVNYSKAIELYEQAQDVYAGSDDINYAVVGTNLGNAYLSYSGTGKTAERIEYAIKYFYEALDRAKALSLELRCALIKTLIARAYVRKATLGNQLETYSSAIEMYGDALSVYTKDKYPPLYRASKKNIGLLKLLSCEYAVDEKECEALAESAILNLEEWISCFSLNLNEEYGAVSTAMGDAHMILSSLKERQSHEDSAARCYNDALGCFPQDSRPEHYLELIQRLESLYDGAMDSSPQDSWVIIEFCKKALLAYKFDIYPYEYASTNMRLGRAYINSEDSAPLEETINKAVSALRESLRGYSVMDAKEECAQVNKELGDLYSDLARAGGSMERYREAISCYDESIKFFTAKTHPGLYGEIKKSLGAAYGALADGQDGDENYLRELDSYNKALGVFTREEYSEEYKELRKRMGGVYAMLGGAKGELGDHEGALEHYREALKIFSLDEFPEEYGKYKLELARLLDHKGRLSSDYKIIEEAIGAYRDSTAYYTLEDRPHEHNEIKDCVGGLYKFLSEIEAGEGESGRPLIKELLEICTTKEAPYEHALLQMKLGDSYLGATTRGSAIPDTSGSSIEDLRTALEFYSEALNFYVQDSYQRERAYIDFRLGAVLRALANFENEEDNLLKSRGFYEEAVEYCTEVEHPQQYAVGCAEIGEIYTSLAGLSIDSGDLNKALEGLDQAKNYYQKAGLADNAADITRQSGDIYIELSGSEDRFPRLESASECYEEFLAHNAESANTENNAELLKTLAGIELELAAHKREQGVYLKVIDHAGKSLEWFTRDNNSVESATLNHMIAEASYGLSTFEDNVKWLDGTVISCRSALEASESIDYENRGDVIELLTKAYVDLAKELEGSGDLSGSAENYTQALELHGERDEDGAKAWVSALLGGVYEKLAQAEDKVENAKSAINSYTSAYDYYQGMGDEERSSELLRHVDGIYELLGGSECGDENEYLEIMEICAKEKAPLQYAHLSKKLGNLYRAQIEGGGNIDISQKSFEAYEDAMSIYESHNLINEKNEVLADKALLINIISDMSLSEGRYDEALSGYNEALGIFDSLELGKEYSQTEAKIGALYVNSAERYEKEASGSTGAEAYGKCVDEYMSALGIFCEARNPEEFGSVHMKLSSIYLNLGERESSLEYYNKAIGSCREALRVFTPDDYPERHMEIQNNIVKAYESITDINNRETSETEEISDAPQVIQRSDEKPYLQVVKSENQEEVVLEPPLNKPEPQEMDAVPQAVMAKAASGDSGVDAVFDEPEFSDSSQAIDYYTKALMTETAESSPERYGWIKSKLGGLYTEVAKSTGSASNFRRAVKSYEDSLEIYSSDRYPEKYGLVQKSIAESLELFAEQSGDLKNYRGALEAYKNALSVFEINTSPGVFGSLNMNIGCIYDKMAEISGNADEYENSISAYNEALRVFNAENSPKEYGYIQRRKGIAYGILAEVGSDIDKYKEAVQAYTKALDYYSYESAPEEYGEISKFLGIAYENLASVSGEAGLLKKAAESYNRALEFYTEQRSLPDYTLIQKNLGSTYEELLTKEQSSESAILAVRAYNEALKYYKRDNLSLEYASIESSLGGLYRTLSESQDKVKNLRKSIESYERVIQVFDIKEFPVEFAATENNIGIVFRTLAEVEDKGKNCKRAINAYKEALKIYSRSGYPEQYGSTQTNLGSAYRTLAEVEDKEANCRHALRAFEEALKVRTIREHPLQFAATQNNLGVVYRTLGDEEDRAKNTKKAIDAYETALIIYSIDKYPIQYASTQNNIGAAYTTLAEVVNKEENCQKAIHAYREALKIFTRERFPGPHELVSTNLKLLQDFCSGEA